MPGKEGKWQVAAFHWTPPPQQTGAQDAVNRNIQLECAQTDHPSGPWRDPPHLARNAAYGETDSL